MFHKGHRELVPTCGSAIHRPIDLPRPFAVFAVESVCPSEDLGNVENTGTTSKSLGTANSECWHVLFYLSFNRLMLHEAVR
jgi:hypothetical protein